MEVLLLLGEGWLEMSAEPELGSGRERSRWRWGGVEVTSQGKTWKERGLAPRAVGRGVSWWNKAPDVASMVTDQDPREVQWGTAHRGTGAMAATVG